VTEVAEAAFALRIAERGLLEEAAAVRFLGEQQRVLKFDWTEEVEL